MGGAPEKKLQHISPAGKAREGCEIFLSRQHEQPGGRNTLHSRGDAAGWILPPCRVKETPDLCCFFRAPLKAYADIIASAAPSPSPDDFAALKHNRKNITDWMLTQDYGVKVTRQKNIPMQLIEAYGFPPGAV